MDLQAYLTLSEPLLLAILLAVAVITLLTVLIGLFRLSSTVGEVNARIDELEDSDERLARDVREEMARNRQEFAENSRDSRQELGSAIHQLSQVLFARLNDLMANNTEHLERLRAAMAEQLGALQQDNQLKLEQIRQTVDEKLHNTLEQRLGESFKLVSERLEQVHQGLGEMQSLASGVGDLKRVLSNVKVRGTWGEVQLGSLLEQILIPEQFGRNVATRPGSNDRVEFAIRLPGKEDGSILWLPIDSKFPLEDYERLIDAQEAGRIDAIDELGKALESRVKFEARSLRDKYLEPPYTTDFGLLFLPIEGLYAEIIRRPGLSDLLQRDYRVTVTGPSTLTAILNSLQMGFRTLAIEQRSSEVWKTLGAVKTEFHKFGAVLEKTRKKLDEARSSIDQAETRTRQISRKLGKVEELPLGESAALLGDLAALPDDEGDG